MKPTFPDVLYRAKGSRHPFARASVRMGTCRRFTRHAALLVTNRAICGRRPIAHESGALQKLAEDARRTMDDRRHAGRVSVASPSQVMSRQTCVARLGSGLDPSVVAVAEGGTSVIGCRRIARVCSQLARWVVATNGGVVCSLHSRSTERWRHVGQGCCRGGVAAALL
jgi:hypothetical protein